MNVAVFTPNRIERDLSAVLDKAIAEKQIVGAVLLVSLSGHLIYQRAAGLADREARKPMCLDTVFRWASLTKVVIATATLALAEQDVFSLDDPVTRFLPEFRPRMANGEAPVITVRHLITHTAGLTYRLFEPEDGPYHRADVSDGMDQPGLSIEENLRRIASVPLLRAPGQGWGYSVATDVLGEFIARAARLSLPELVKNLVTDPLGMTDSAFSIEDRNRLATPYGDAAPEPVRMGARHAVPFGGGLISFAPDRMFNSNSYPSGGSGMVGTASDFLRLIEALRLGGAPVLSARSIELASTIGRDDVDIMLPGWKWPLCWSVLADPSKAGTPQSPGTWRWGGVYGASWFVDPARNLSVVFLTNTAIAGMLGPVPDAIRDAVYGAIQAA